MSNTLQISDVGTAGDVLVVIDGKAGWVNSEAYKENIKSNIYGALNQLGLTCDQATALVQMIEENKLPHVKILY